MQLSAELCEESEIKRKGRTRTKKVKARPCRAGGEAWGGVNDALPHPEDGASLGQEWRRKSPWWGRRPKSTEWPGSSAGGEGQEKLLREKKKKQTRTVCRYKRKRVAEWRGLEVFPGLTCIRDLHWTGKRGGWNDRRVGKQEFNKTDRPTSQFSDIKRKVAGLKRTQKVKGEAEEGLDFFVLKRFYSQCYVNFV